ncbi:MAG: 3-dehydroquinate synthase [Nitrospinota bacterium]|nr:3-dehydroquinate synthase [Nitrospinota bacterium]
MKRLNIDLGERSYEILIGQGLLAQTGTLLCQAVSASKGVIITHPAINSLYGEKVAASLRQAKVKVDCIEVPEGEDHKSLAEAEKVFGKLLQFNCDRKTVLVALGGGVIGDITGFVAATFMRGIPFIQVPTTLLAQVDSSVGGKTAVNHSLGKNMIGAFYQPKRVIIDLDTLKTLPEEEFRAGLAEVIKYGVIADGDLFDYLDQQAENILQMDAACLEHIVETSCAIKTQVVQKDEKENRHRMILNFGHTLGHAIEALTNYKKYKHGEAIAIGMVFAAKVSREMGRCPEMVCQRLTDLVEKFGLPSKLPDFQADRLIESMRLDKKTHNEKIRFILTKEIGSIEIVDQISESVLKKILEN